MTRMDRVLGIVQAGGKGSRLGALTRTRAKPAVPFAGEYQLIDFALSAMAHARLPDVWVSVQYLAGSLDPHLAGGRPWDLDRTRGGYRRVVPEQGPDDVEFGFSTGNADDLYRLWKQVEAAAPELVVVMSADHIFALDLRDVVDRHRSNEAECTLVTAEVSAEEAAHNAVVTTGRGGLVRDLTYKPEDPATGTVATEIFVYDVACLRTALGELRARRKREMSDDEADEDSGLGDFGEYLLPWFVARGRTYAFEMPGYWRDVGRIESYFGAHRDLLAGRIDALGQPELPVLTRREQRPAARIEQGALVQQSVVSSGCVVHGRVERSVLGPGVVVEAGAEVTDSIIFADTRLAAGCRVRTAIVDEHCRVGTDARVGAAPAGTRPRDADITIVGRHRRVTAGETVTAGTKLDPTGEVDMD